MQLMYKILFSLAPFFLAAEEGNAVLEEVSTLLKAELSQKISTPDFDIHIDNWTKTWESEKAKSFTLKDLKVTQNQSRFQVHVEGFKTSKRLYGKIEWLVEVPTLNRILHPGEEIQESDLDLKRVPSHQLNVSHLTNKAQLIGMTARFNMLKPGAPLTKNDIQNPIIAKKGALIRVHYKKGRLSVTNKGIALKDGSKNNTIPIEMMTPDGKGMKKTIYAMLVGPDDAELKV